MPVPSVGARSARTTTSSGTSASGTPQCRTTGQSKWRAASSSRTCRPSKAPVTHRRLWSVTCVHLFYVAKQKRTFGNREKEREQSNPGFKQRYFLTATYATVLTLFWEGELLSCDVLNFPQTRSCPRPGSGSKSWSNTLTNKTVNIKTISEAESKSYYFKVIKT